MTEIRLGGGPEFDRIRSIARHLGERGVGLGDDCAFIEAGGEVFALSTDVSVEGVHFRREWLSLEEIGWRAAAAALSDLAAVGATPIGLLAAVTVPAGAEPAMTDALMVGVGGAAGSVGGVVLGGDLSRGEAIALAITVVGRAKRVTHRKGAQPGDGLWVTGDLGAARAAVTAWRSGRAPAPAARARFAKPAPRIEAGRWLTEHGAKAMLDLSDGLAGDASHLAAASTVGLRIELERLPVHPAVAAEADAAGEPPAAFAAVGGEDYELLAALPAEFGGTDRFLLTRIGEVTAGSGVSLLLDGRAMALTGYDHFA